MINWIETHKCDEVYIQPLTLVITLQSRQALCCLQVGASAVTVDFYTLYNFTGRQSLLARN